MPTHTHRCVAIVQQCRHRRQLRHALGRTAAREGQHSMAAHVGIAVGECRSQRAEVRGALHGRARTEEAGCGASHAGVPVIEPVGGVAHEGIDLGGFASGEEIEGALARHLQTFAGSFRHS